MYGAEITNTTPSLSLISASPALFKLIVRPCESVYTKPYLYCPPLEAMIISSFMPFHAILYSRLASVNTPS